MKIARDVMESARTVKADVSVQELAKELLAEHVDGLCVVDDDGQLIGVVTSMDLIYQEKRLHLPTFFVLFDGVLPLESPRKALDELNKISGSTVADVMSPDPVVVAPDATLDHVASLMVEQHISVIPVVEGGALVGMVTKPGMLRAAFRA